jgi:CubicO group peptidase (beta-lactamase class C family)
LLTVIIATNANSQKVWPTKAWQKTRPKDVGLNVDTLAFIDKELASGRYGYIDGLLVIRHGKIAFEKSYQHDYYTIYKKEASVKSGLNLLDPTGPYNYFNAWWHPFYHDSKLHAISSVTKTVNSVTIGTALARHEFPDLNTPILKYFDTTKVKNIDDRKRRITIRHLLTMTGGFRWNEDDSFSDSNNINIMMSGFDWVQYAIDQPMTVEPGTVFNYNGGGIRILNHIFRLATGTDLEEYAAKHLFNPLGIKNFYWKRMPTGLVDGSGGLYLEKRDLAKIFYLYLQNGKWEGKQLVTPDYIKQSVTPSIAVDTNQAYGYGWWLYTYDNSDKSKLAWTGLGFGDQTPFAIPEYDIVVVVNGWNILTAPNDRVPDFVRQEVLHAIINNDNKNRHKMMVKHIKHMQATRVLHHVG